MVRVGAVKGLAAGEEWIDNGRESLAAVSLSR